MAKAKAVKTNAMRILDSNKIEHKELTYPVDKDHVDGVTVAHSIGRDEKEVYKTLVAQGHSKEFCICYTSSRIIRYEKSSQSS